MQTSNQTDAGQDAAPVSVDTSKGGSAQDSQNGNQKTQSQAAAAEAAYQDELEDLDNQIASLTFGPMPGEKPVSLDGRGQQVGETVNPNEPKRHEFDASLSINNPKVELPQAQESQAPQVPQVETPKEEKQEEEEEQTQPGQFPQYRLRPGSDRDKQILGVVKALGCSIEEATEVVKQREAKSQPASQAKDALADLPAGVPRDLQALSKEREAKSDEVNSLAKQIRETAKKLAASKSMMDYDVVDGLTEELATLTGKQEEAEAKLQELVEAEGKVQVVHSAKEEAAQAAWRAMEAEVAEKYADLGWADENSPIRKAAKEAHQDLMDAEDPRLSSPNYPKIYAANAKLYLQNNPGKYGAASPAAAPGVSQEVPKPTIQPAPTVIGPARGNVPPGPPAPSTLGRLVDEAQNTSDLEELLMAYR